MGDQCCGGNKEEKKTESCSTEKPAEGQASEAKKEGGCCGGN